MTDDNTIVELETLGFQARQKHNSRIRTRFEELGFTVEIIEFPYQYGINDEFRTGEKNYIKIGYNFINTNYCYCIEVPDLETKIEPDDDNTIYYYQEGDYEVKTVKSILKDMVLPIREMYWGFEIKYLYPLKRKIKLIKLKAKRKKSPSLV